MVGAVTPLLPPLLLLLLLLLPPPLVLLLPLPWFALWLWPELRDESRRSRGSPDADRPDSELLRFAPARGGGGCAPA